MNRLYYITQWTDEEMPCQPTLDAWAKWLSEPDEQWGRTEPATLGDQFAASVTLELPDIQIHFFDGEWGSDFSPAPGANWFALRYGPGLGVDNEMSHDSFASLLEELKDGSESEGDEELIAQFQQLPGEVMLEYRLTPEGPVLVELAPVS